MELFFILPFISFVFLKITYVLLLKKKVVDIPNVRSMHSIPKIRGGGIAILFLYSISITIAVCFNYIEFKQFTTLLLGAVILGVVGWLDDIKSLKASIRMISHVVTAFIPLIIMYQDLKIIFSNVCFKELLILLPFYLLYISWFINLYNFMDGLDGLAITQLIVPSIFLVLLFYYIIPIQSIALLVLFIILIGIPFYYFNWYPSKMFMGDVLSGFLGFYFAFISIYLTVYHNISFFLIPVLLSFFIFDASYTLFIRICKKEKLWEAHNNHIYQLAAKKYGHKKVTLFAMIYNFFMFIPGYLIVKHRTYDFLIAIILYGGILAVIISIKKTSMENKQYIN